MANTQDYDLKSCTDTAAPHPHFQPLRHTILQMVANVFGVPPRELAMRTRGPAKVAFARQVAMYLAHVGCGFSLSDVGRIFRRDRKTVSHACMIVEDRRDDPAFDLSIDVLEAVARIQASPIRALANPEPDKADR